MTSGPLRRSGALLLLTLVSGGCVDKAPPPLWPSPPPPSVAEVLGEPSQRKSQLPVGAVGASALAGPPSPLDSVPVDQASILDPDGPARAAAAQAHPPPRPPRPLPTHR